MNVARKSTTKLPQNWQQVQGLQTKEDACNGNVAANSSDSFQDAVLSLKALSGNSDVVGSDSDRSELKEMQTMCSKEKDSDSKVSASPSQENGEEDILDQIDNIVNDKKDDNVNEIKTTTSTNNKVIGNGISESHNIIKDIVKSDLGSDEEEDGILVIHEDDSSDFKKEGKKSSLPKDLSDSKSKMLSSMSGKPPLKIGEKVRSTVHSIMSKLVQSNPDVNSLLIKAKAEDHADSGGSRAGSPLPPRIDKGNLFDKFDMSERDCKSAPITSNSEAKNRSSPLLISFKNEGEKVVEDSLKDTKELANKGDGNSSTDSKPEELSAEDPLSQCPVPEDISTLNDQKMDTTKSDSELVECEKSRLSVDDESNSESLQQPISPDREDTNASEGCVEEKRDVAVTLTDSDSKQTDQSVIDGDQHKNEEKSSLEVGASDLTDNGCVSGLVEAESMETSEQESSDRITEGIESAGLDKDFDKERKRPHDADSDNDEDSASQSVKRSRLDEMIGKLGERVTVPSETPVSDSFEYEDSPAGDTESVEKQSEEISGSASEEEEGKGSPDSDSEDKSNWITMSKKELETLVITTAKVAIEQFQSTEFQNLNRRIKELKESQEEWRQKAKDLERQVLDITVLQQRLEKRKAHTAALKSITTRSFGVWVTEDKLKSNTPQKNQGNKSPTGAPSSMPAILLNSIGQPVTRSLTTTSPSVLSTPNVNASAMPTVASRNTSVAHLLSQTARMPTVASCSAANHLTPSKGTSSAPRTSLTMTTISARQSDINHLAKGTNATIGGTGLVLVNAVSSVPVGSKMIATGQPTTAPSVASGGSVKIIDLTMEDDSAAAKLSNSKVLAQNPVRHIVPQQMVRQITPLTQQGLAGVPSSAILLSSPAGTQVVNAGNLQRPGMLQVVTIANAQNLRPGSLLTMVAGQPGALVRHPTAPTTLTTNAREAAPRLMTQQLPPGMAFVRPPPTLLSSTTAVRAPVVVSTAVGATAMTPTPTRIPLALTTLPASVPITPAAATPVQQETASTQASILPVTSSEAAAPKKNPHPAPVPAPLLPKGLLANLKPVPPKPGLKISRVKQGIVLSWNMTLPNDCVEIASYQLYAYQETNATPQTSLWKKVGDVKALPLPMACTLTQFQDGNKYHFAVRAVDVHGRSGNFSDPSFIFLTKST